MRYTYEIFYSKLTEVTGRVNPLTRTALTKTWVTCSFKTTNCAVISHLKKLQQQEDRGMIRNIEVKTLNSVIG